MWSELLAVPLTASTNTQKTKKAEAEGPSMFTLTYYKVQQFLNQRKT
jgi:hypothetical protein